MSELTDRLSKCSAVWLNDAARYTGRRARWRLARAERLAELAFTPGVCPYCGAHAETLKDEVEHHADGAPGDRGETVDRGRVDLTPLEKRRAPCQTTTAP